VRHLTCRFTVRKKYFSHICWGWIVEGPIPGYLVPSAYIHVQTKNNKLHNFLLWRDGNVRLNHIIPQVVSICIKRFMMYNIQTVFLNSEKKTRGGAIKAIKGNMATVPHICPSSSECLCPPSVEIRSSNFRLIPLWIFPLGH
jgi:hypothetical protein